MRQAVNPAAMKAVGAKNRRFRLQVDTRCPCKGCVGNVQKAMDSIGSFSGVDKSVGDVHTGIVTVTGKVNQTELCRWLKKETRKDVQIVCPDLSAENRKQKIILGRESSSGSGTTTRSAPSSRSCPSGPHSDRKELQQIDDKIRDLQKDRDRLIIKKEKKKLAADNCRFNQVINDAEKVVLDSALNNLKALKKLDSLRRSRMG